MREYTGESGFLGACESIAELGAGEFMVSVGDIDPPGGVLSAVQSALGADYPWYPVVGNHEAETGSAMTWLRSFTVSELEDVLSWGPEGAEETTYSFDRENVHFVVLNQYYDGVADTGAVDGDVSAGLLNWLIADLEANDKPVVFVFGHEPAFPQPDEENGRERHFGNSLDLFPENRDRFWNTLAEFGVSAYVCGHTHNYSALEIDGVWQIDTGHVRGYAGDPGARSTHLLFQVLQTGKVIINTYRLRYLSDVYERVGVFPLN